MSSPQEIIDPLGLFAKPKMPPIPAPPKLPARKDTSGEAERLAALRRKGRSSTIVTGGAGVTSDAPLSRPEALGA